MRLQVNSGNRGDDAMVMSAVIAFLVQHWLLASVAAGVAIVMFLSRHSGNEVLPAFERRGCLVTEAELRFYRALQAAVGGSWSVFAMVRLADVVKVRKGVAGAGDWRNKTFGKHVDFILCDNDSLEIRMAIELDEASHQRKDRQQRDALVGNAIASAGLPLLRVPVAEGYDKIQLRKTIDQMLGK
jgi:hypothetical protein